MRWCALRAPHRRWATCTRRVRCGRIAGHARVQTSTRRSQFRVFRPRNASLAALKYGCVALTGRATRFIACGPLRSIAPTTQAPAFHFRLIPADHLCHLFLISADHLCLYSLALHLRLYCFELCLDSLTIQLCLNCVKLALKICDGSKLLVACGLLLGDFCFELLILICQRLYSLQRCNLARLPAWCALVALVDTKPV